MIKRIPNIKTIKIGEQTFETGKVYSSPFHKAFTQPSTEITKNEDSSTYKEEPTKDKWYLDYNNGR